MNTFKETFKKIIKGRPKEDKPMISVKTLDICGMLSVLQALRLPFGKECRSLEESDFAFEEGQNVDIWYERKYCEIDHRDLLLLSTLVRRGDEHSKAIRGLIVYTEIDAPRFFWQEMDTYKVGTERLSSESTMHIQGKGLSTEELVKMKSDLKEGTMQKRIQMFSYQTLRRIYYQRRDHRLPHWRLFCEWMETLPYFNELIKTE